MIPFFKPRIDQKVIDAVVDTLKSGWITTGPKTALFEEKLTEYGGHKATICVSSATAGLELILRWFGIKEGDEVIVPAYTYSATANVVLHCGAKIVLVDVEKDFNISVNAIEAAITERTKVIIPVDIAGWPCDYNSINELVQRKVILSKFSATTPEQVNMGRILVLADSAHSIGSHYNNQRSGSYTDISVFSFHAVKNITTAEGGAVCVNLPGQFDSQKICHQLKIKSLHGQSKDGWSKTQDGGWKYDVIEAGYKCNMTDLQAAMGLIELERYDQGMLPKRKEIFRQYRGAFEKQEWAELPPYQDESRESAYHVYLLRIKDISEQQRDTIIQEIISKEVIVNVHFLPLPMLTYYKEMGFSSEDYPVSVANYEKEITLPVYYDLSDDDIQQVVTTVTESVQKVIG